MGCASSVPDDNKLYWSISYIATINDHTKNVLIPILKDFVDIYCMIDPKTHVMVTELFSAFYTYVRSRDINLCMTKETIIHCFITLIKELPLDITTTNGFYYFPDYSFVAIKGLSLKSYPSRMT